MNARMRKVFAYGFRNGFGMAFDPKSGDLWAQENGDDAFSEINRVERGMNTESESLLVGENFGVVTDIETGPNGNLYVVSLSGGAVYEIFAK